MVELRSKINAVVLMQCAVRVRLAKLKIRRMAVLVKLELAAMTESRHHQAAELTQRRLRAHMVRTYRS